MGAGHASDSAVQRRVEEHILKLASGELHFETEAQGLDRSTHDPAQWRPHRRRRLPSRSADLCRGLCSARKAEGRSNPESRPGRPQVGDSTQAPRAERSALRRIRRQVRGSHPERARLAGRGGPRLGRQAARRSARYQAPWRAEQSARPTTNDQSSAGLSSRPKLYDLRRSPRQGT